jgi:hypothetical protein
MLLAFHSLRLEQGASSQKKPQKEKAGLTPCRKILI